MQLQSYRRFPTDEEFKREIQTRNLYTNRLRSYWPRRMENHMRKERVNTDEYSVEHIMPQNENLSQEWQDELGPDWRQIQEQWFHRLGNLTLTGYNAEYSDKPFRDKRDMNGGFKQSPLRLNEDLRSEERWNVEAMQRRGSRLAERAAQIWPMPTLPEEVFNAYKAKTSTDRYSIEQHPHLMRGPMAAVFAAFRAEVLRLDPCVTEEVLKLYIAYKAETNFVDLIPQAKRLCLSLNIPFDEIDDPMGRCRDVSNLGRWGNGSVEVGLSNINDLPYIMGLVRQAFEVQMGGPEA